MIYTIVINDDDFKVEGKEMCSGQMLKPLLPQNSKLVINVCSLMHVPRMIRHYIQCIKENLPESSPFSIAVHNVHALNFLKRFCGLVNVYNIQIDIMDKIQYFSEFKAFVHRQHGSPYFHDYIHEDENSSSCSIRIAWWYARFCQYHSLM